MPHSAAVGCAAWARRRDATACRLPSGFGGVSGYGALGVSAERDELRRLVEQLSDDRVPAVLAEARGQSGSVPAGAWPPPWFGSFASGRSDLGSNHEDLLAEGFSRS
jgi:hypothetical protein